MGTALDPGAGTPLATRRRRRPLMFGGSIGLLQLFGLHRQRKTRKSQRDSEFHNTLPFPDGPIPALYASDAIPRPQARQSGKSRGGILFYAAMQHVTLHGKFAHGTAGTPGLRSPPS